MFRTGNRGNSMEKNKKANTKKTVIIVSVLMVCVVGILVLYAYLSTKQRDAMADAKLSTVQLVLSQDLEKNYPPTVKQVVTSFVEIQKCMYNEECTEEELEQLGMQARLLYDKELLDNNEVTTYLVRLKTEAEAFKAAERRISRASIAASNNVETFKEDGYEFARIHCNYYYTEKKGPMVLQEIVYLLRRDENRQWKIYGWDKADKTDTAQ